MQDEQRGGLGASGNAAGEAWRWEGASVWLSLRDQLRCKRKQKCLRAKLLLGQTSKPRTRKLKGTFLLFPAKMRLLFSDQGSMGCVLHVKEEQLEGLGLFGTGEGGPWDGKQPLCGCQCVISSYEVAVYVHMILVVWNMLVASIPCRTQRYLWLGEQ